MQYNIIQGFTTPSTASLAFSEMSCVMYGGKTLKTLGIHNP